MDKLSKNLLEQSLVSLVLEDYNEQNHKALANLRQIFTNERHAATSTMPATLIHTPGPGLAKKNVRLGRPRGSYKKKVAPNVMEQANIIKVPLTV